MHITTTFAGRARGDCIRGHGSALRRVGPREARGLDGRRDSATRGQWAEFVVSDRNPGLLIVPPNLYHGWKNIGNDEAVIINMPDRMYDYEQPDALDLPWDSQAARDLIPYAW